VETEYKTVNLDSLTDESWTRTWQISRLKLLVKDPGSLFAYWEVDDVRKTLISEHFQCAWMDLSFSLQLYDVTHIDFDGSNAHTIRQIRVHPLTDNWYIHDVQPGRHYLLDFGVSTCQGKFVAILRSNHVECPSVPVASSRNPSIRFGSPWRKSPPRSSLLTKLPPVAEVNIRKFSIPYAQEFDGYSVRSKGGDRVWRKGI